MAFGDSLLAAADLLLAGAIIYLLVTNWPRLRMVLVLALGVAAAGGAALAGEWLAQRWHGGFAQHYDQMLSHGLFSYIERTQPAGSGVCVLDLRPYPFFGSARQFRVCQPQRVRSRQELEDYLRSREVALVAARFDMSLTARGWLNCRRWLADDPEHLVLLHEGPWPYTVYRATYPNR